MRSATVTFLIVLMALTFPMVVASPVHAAGDRPTVTPGDSGKQINTVVEASGERGTHAHSGRPAPDGSMGGVGQVAGEPIVLTDPQCVATDPAGSWCARSPEDGTAGATPTPFELAIKATNQLPLPNPDPRYSPNIRFADGRIGGIVGLPMWLWINEKNWTALRQRTQAGQNWAEVTARPVKQIWDFGEGRSVTCSGHGTRYKPGMAVASGSPDCSYKYSHSSSHEANGEYKIQVTVLWQVTWIGNGNTSGTLGPLGLSTSFGYIVREARAQLVAP